MRHAGRIAGQSISDSAFLMVGGSTCASFLVGPTRGIETGSLAAIAVALLAPTRGALRRW